MTNNDELLIDVLRAAGHERAAALAARVLEAREPQPEPEPEPEPEPVAPSAAPAAPSLADHVLDAMRRDLPHIAPAAAPDGLGEAA